MDSVTLLTVRCHLSWRWRIGILQLKEIEFVPKLFNFKSSRLYITMMKMLSGFLEWKSSVLRKFPSFEWPRQTSVALSHLLKSLSQGLLFNSGAGERNYIHLEV